MWEKWLINPTIAPVVGLGEEIVLLVNRIRCSPRSAHNVITDHRGFNRMYSIRDFLSYYLTGYVVVSTRYLEPRMMEKPTNMRGRASAKVWGIYGPRLARLSLRGLESLRQPRWPSPRVYGF